MTPKNKPSILSRAIFLAVLFSIIGLLILFPFILWYLHIRDKQAFWQIFHKLIALILCLLFGILFCWLGKPEFLVGIGIILIFIGFFLGIRILIELAEWLFDKGLLGRIIMLSIILGFGTILLLAQFSQKNDTSNSKVPSIQKVM